MSAFLLAMALAAAIALGFTIGHETAHRAPVVPQIGSAISYIPPCPSIAPGNRPGPCVAKP